MLGFILKKAFSFFVSILSAATICFWMMKAIPGDPFTNEVGIPKEVLASLHAYYGLDKPLWIQYFKYIKGILTLDLGPSLVYHGRTVNQIICDGFPHTFFLGMQTLFISLSLGIPLGVISAWKKSKWQDTSILLISTLSIAIPNFVIASLAQYMFSVKLNILPVARWESFSHTILPTFSLSLLPIAYITRLMRSSMLEVLGQDYIQTAYAKGMRSSMILWRHGLRNALLPVIAYLGPLMTYLMTGSFVIERIFAIPGLGQWLIHSITSRDYSAIIGLVVFYCFILLLSNFLVDIAYGIVDPRIRKKAR